MNIDNVYRLGNRYIELIAYETTAVDLTVPDTIPTLAQVVTGVDLVTGERIKCLIRLLKPLTAVEYMRIKRMYDRG